MGDWSDRVNWIILVPQGAEYQAVQRGLIRRQRAARSGKGETSIRAIAIPAGPFVKTWLTEEFVAFQVTPFDNTTQFLVLGLCGGLSDRTRLGTVVLYRPHASSLAQRLGIQSVQGLTIDRVICLAAEKYQLAQDSKADVVDMESQWIVEYIESFGGRVNVVRVVSDDAKGDLPDLSAAFDTSGELRPWALAMAFARNPIAALRLIRGALIALRQLEEWVTKLDLEHLKV